MANYVLNPHLKLCRYANQYFTYDVRVSAHPLVEIPTSSITEQDYGILRKLKTDVFFLQPRSRRAILNHFSKINLQSELYDRLLAQHFLQEHTSRVESLEKSVLDFFNERYRSVHSKTSSGSLFDENDGHPSYFNARTFFNLPREIEPQECDVGILGIPHASVDVSLGTEAAPFQLRLHSRSLCWFEIYQEGVYSEVAFDGGKPVILGKQVVVKDCGDLDFQNLTLSQMYDKVKQTLSVDFFDHQVYPLIVGGDHAITYPIVSAYLDTVPNLGLLHLDAHNDLFYTPQAVYSHAAPISNLVKRSPIERIVSFGLRTYSDKRMTGLRSIYRLPDTSDRIRLYSLTSLKQMIMSPGALEQELERLADRPYYLSLDLDVLSESSIGGQVSTPFGVGLEWHELFYFLEVAFRKLNIIGCDVVEYNSGHGDNGNNRFLVNSLFLLTIDRLARNNPKHSRSLSAESTL